MIGSRVLRSAISSFAGLLILPLAVVFSQEDAARKIPPKGTGTSAGTPAPETRAPEMRVLFVTGVVVMDDGSPVPAGTTIEKSCDGRVTSEAYVLPSGGFSFQLGGNRSSRIVPDASETYEDFPTRSGSRNSGRTTGRMGGGMSTGRGLYSVSRVSCEIRARLAGYRSTYVSLDATNVGQVDTGPIVLAPMTRLHGTMVSATNLMAPKSARKAAEKAQGALQERRFEEAEKLFQRAVELYPGYAAAFTGMGELYLATDRLPEAREAYRKAISLDDKYVPPYVSLARLAAIERNWQETADLTDRAILLDPIDFPQGYYLNAVAHYELNEIPAAERSARKLNTLDPQHRIPQALLILSGILERKQDIPGAIEQLQKYLAAAPQAPNRSEVQAHLRKLQDGPRLAEKNPE